MPEHDRTWRRRLGGDALQATDPLPRQRAELDPDGGRGSRDRVVFVSLDPHHTRRLRSAKAERECRRERDRHFAEELTYPAAADNTRNPVLDCDGLQVPLAAPRTGRVRHPGAPHTRRARARISAATRERRSRSTGPRSAKIQRCRRSRPRSPRESLQPGHDIAHPPRPGPCGRLASRCEAVRRFVGNQAVPHAHRGAGDSNSGPLRPERSALPGCATPRAGKG